MGRGKIDRTLLINKASQLFSQSGYYNTTMDDIAKACNIQKSSLYHHIPSRKALVLMTINHIIDNTKQQLQHVYDSKLTPQERLYALANTIEQIVTETNSYTLIMTLTIEIAETIPEVNLLTKQYFQEWINAISSVLGEVYDTTKARHTAEDILSHVQGAIFLAKSLQKTEIFKRAIQCLQKSLPMPLSITT